MKRPGHQARLQILGAALLLAGVGAGGFLYWQASQTDPDEEDPVHAQEQSRAYELAVQKNVGAVGLMTARWSEWLGSPQGVAVEVALAGCLAGGVCFLLAVRPFPK